MGDPVRRSRGLGLLGCLWPGPRARKASAGWLLRRAPLRTPLEPPAFSSPQLFRAQSPPRPSRSIWMSPPRSSSTETCREKWATLFLEAGAGGGVAVGLAGKLCRGLSSGVVPLRYSSGLSCCKGVPVEMTSMSSLER